MDFNSFSAVGFESEMITSKGSEGSCFSSSSISDAHM